MKKLIALFILISVATGSYSQENRRTSQSNERTETNSTTQDVNILKETIVGTGKGLGEFAHGFYNQGVNTAEGIYHSVKELPDALRELLDVGDSFSDYIEFGQDYAKYLGKTTIEAVVNTAQNAISEDPEKKGRAAFDIVFAIAGGKVTGRVGKMTASRYGPAYHYTTLDAAKSIAKGGIKTGKDGFWYATFDPTLTTTEAQNALALRPEIIPTTRIMVKRKGLIPDKIRNVAPKNGRSGGGIEQLYSEGISADNIISIEPIDMDPTIATRVKRLAGESTNYSTGAVLLGENKAEKPSEGGHELNAKINIVVITKDSIKPGGFKLIDMDDERFVLINSADINRLTPQFYNKISGNEGNHDFEDEEISTDRNRNREEIIPSNNRTQRGL